MNNEQDDEQKCGYCKKETDEKLVITKFGGSYYFCCKECVAAQDDYWDRRIMENRGK